MKNQKLTRTQASRWRRRKLLFTRVESGSHGVLGKTAAPREDHTDTRLSRTYSCAASDR